MIFNNTKNRQLAVLIDPEKCYGEKLTHFLELLSINTPDYIFVGGSQMQESVEGCVAEIKRVLSIPIILFPGAHQQIASNVDAILFLSLISGRNPEYLIGQQVKSAQRIKKLNIETIPTGYILVDGGKITSVQKMSNTEPLSSDDINIISSTAIAGEMLGMKAIYLEAGSGANKCVSPDIVKTVRKSIESILIVGGGITTREQMDAAYDSGADIVVIGNYLEQHPEDVKLFISKN